MDIHFKDLAVAPRVQGLEAEVRRDAAVLGLPQDKVEASLAARDYFGVLELYVPLLYSGIQMEAGPARALQTTLEELLRIKTFTHPLAWRGVEGVVHSMVPVVFGTAGHRGEIGLGLTLFHVHVIIGAFIQMVEAMAPHDRAAHFGAADLDHVKEMGMVLGHDNRLFNPEFSAYAAHLLANAGYRVMYGARVSTPELSRVVPYRGFAGAVNFTPSHNPFRYGGIKLNPADGGLAGPELTDSLAVEANRMMKELPGRDWLEYDALDSLVGDRLASLVRVDVHSAYLEALALHPVIRLDELCQTLKEMGSKAAWAVDPTWGASVPVYQRLQEKVGSEVMTVLHTEDDSYFGGQTTEPNEETLSDALRVLKSSKAQVKVAVRNDPDSDRAIVGDDGGAIKMNRFAPLVMRYLMDLGLEGGLVTTYPTSQFGPRFAQSQGRNVSLTPTGFKNFRPFLQSGNTLVAYEESDGISIAGHTLDKDGVLAGLLALRIVLHYGKPLTQLVEELEAAHGKFYWLQDTFAIDIPAAQAKQKLRLLSRYTKGMVLDHQGRTYTIAQVHTEDGYHFEFEDGSWMMMRPSGTEPKVRVYAETTEGIPQTKALCALARKLAMEAIQTP